MKNRIKSERKKLGLTQAEFSEACGVKLRAQSNYEAGKNVPDADYLEKAHELGVDITYLITGKPADNGSLSAEEAFLLQQFRGLSDEQKKMVLGFLLGGFDGMNKTEKPQTTVKGKSNSVIVGDKGTINNIKTEKHITRTKAEVKPGKEHIDEKMAATIQGLVKEIVELEKQVKQDPRPYATVYASLNRHCGVATYRLIPIELYDKAENHLRKWIGRLTSAKSAPKKIGSEWRKKKYAYIKINIKKFNLDSWLQQHLFDKYSVTSITELTDEQLQKVYGSVASKKRTASKNK